MAREAFYSFKHLPLSHPSQSLENDGMQEGKTSNRSLWGVISGQQ